MESPSSSTCTDYYDCLSVSSSMLTLADSTLESCRESDFLDDDEIDLEFERILEENYPDGIPSDIDEQFDELFRSSGGFGNTEQLQELHDQESLNDDTKDDIVGQRRSGLETIIQLEKVVEYLRIVAAQSPVQPTKPEPEVVKEEITVDETAYVTPGRPPLPPRKSRKASKKSPESTGELKNGDQENNNNNSALLTTPPMTEKSPGSGKRVQRSRSVKDRIAAIEGLSRSASFR